MFEIDRWIIDVRKRNVRFQAIDKQVINNDQSIVVKNKKFLLTCWLLKNLPNWIITRDQYVAKNVYQQRVRSIINWCFDKKKTKTYEKTLMPFENLLTIEMRIFQ